MKEKLDKAYAWCKSRQVSNDQVLGELTKIADLETVKKYLINLGCKNIKP
jgi:hypothetical protein